MKRNVYLFLCLAVSMTTSMFCQIVQRSKLAVHVITQVTTLDTVFIYKYEVFNSLQSEQRLDEFTIEVGDRGIERGGTIKQFISPDGWFSWTSDVVGQPIDPSARGTIILVAEDSVSNQSGLMIPAQSSLPPGTSAIFSFESRGLPTIKRFWARGWARPLFEHEYDSLRALGFTKEQIQFPWYNDSFKGKAIAPQLPPTPFVPLTFLDTLISYKHQAFDLGWIKNQGIVQSLDAKLENVKRQLQRNNRTAAKNILQAFVNEVEALWKQESPPYGGTQITSEAYALLKFNAEYLISKL